MHAVELELAVAPTPDDGALGPGRGGGQAGDTRRRALVVDGGCERVPDEIERHRSFAARARVVLADARGETG